MKLYNKFLIVLITLISVFSLTGCSGKKTLDFQEVLTIEFDGLNGNGNIHQELNQSIFNNEEFLKRLFPDDSETKASMTFLELMDDVEYKFSKQEDLSNGDEITVTVEYDEDKFNEKGITIENTEFKTIVEGLSDGIKIDVFEGLKISYIGLSGKGYTYFDTSNCDDFTKNYVSFQCSESSLSNGDTINVVANYDLDIAEENLVIVESNTKQFTVSGLKEPEEVDPFEKLEVTYTGASPYINVAVDSSKCSNLINEYVSFSLEDKYLRNGDTFTVTAVYDEYEAEENGFIITNETKTYIVENQPEYVTSLDGLDLKDLQKELDDKLTVATTANEGDTYFLGVYVWPFKSIAEQKYCTSYLVSLKTNFENKFDKRNYNYNRYIQIYEYKIDTKSEQKKVYVAVYVNNICKNADGTISWDIELGSTGDKNYDTLVNKFATSEKEFYNVSEIKSK